ncbi:MAG: hypothetical protein WCJ16_07195 [Actinomycetes bacterium]
MKKISILLLLAIFLLSGCSTTKNDSVEINLGNIPYSWKVPKDLASRLFVEIPNNSYAVQAASLGAQEQALIYYTPVKGERSIFMAAYLFPTNSYIAANRADEPPVFGRKVLESKGMVLSISGPQDSLYDPKTSDGKNVTSLYNSIYKPSSYTALKSTAINAGELDSVSSWTSSLATKARQDLISSTKLTPGSIYDYLQNLKNGFADGDAGNITQTLRGSKISFTLNKTSISKYLYLDSSMKLQSTDLVSVNTPQPIVGCFAASLKNNRFFLDIKNQSGLAINASISLNNSEKDSSIGNFVGTFDGTILTGMYTFSSEGMQSNRELFFRATPHGFLEGYGPVTESGDTAKFIRPLSLQWNESYIYKAQAKCAK